MGDTPILKMPDEGSMLYTDEEFQKRLANILQRGRVLGIRERGSRISKAPNP